jgi:hypothetical protein
MGPMCLGHLWVREGIGKQCGPWQSSSLVCQTDGPVLPWEEPPVKQKWLAWGEPLDDRGAYGWCVGRASRPLALDSRAICRQGGRIRRAVPDVDPVCTITAVYRRRALDRVGPWAEHLEVGEDADLNLRVAMAGRFLFRDAVVALNRRHPGNQSRDPSRFPCGAPHGARWLLCAAGRAAARARLPTAI